MELKRASIISFINDISYKIIRLYYEVEKTQRTTFQSNGVRLLDPYTLSAVKVHIWYGFEI